MSWKMCSIPRGQRAGDWLPSSIFHLMASAARRTVPPLQGSLRSSTAPLPSDLVPQLLSAGILRQLTRSFA
jgi:hypothetical protein